MALPSDSPFDDADFDGPDEDATVVGTVFGQETKAEEDRKEIVQDSVQDAAFARNLNVSDISFKTLLDNQILKMSPKQLNAIAPISLAYIGDAVFELYVRSRLLLPSKRIRDYHQQVVSQVKAEQQSCYVDILLPHLNEVERDIVRRGRNATTGRSRRAKGADYQKATGLEALIGFLYLSDPNRLMTLLNHLQIS